MSSSLSEDRTTTRAFQDSLVKAYEDVLPDMLKAVGEADVKDYVIAPILSDESWSDFVGDLPAFAYPTDGVGGFQPKL